MTDADTQFEDVLASAAAPGNVYRKFRWGPVPSWLSGAALAHGLMITEFHHSVDSSSIRHIRAQHGDPAAEQRRGQIAITTDDLTDIETVLSQAQHLVFGAKTRRQLPLIGFIYKAPSATIMALSELRVGRRELALVSMRKYPATIDARTIAGTLNPNGRTDGGARLHIVPITQNVTAIRSAPRS